jgi:hypothetical protein
MAMLLSHSVGFSPLPRPKAVKRKKTVAIGGSLMYNNVEIRIVYATDQKMRSKGLSL